MQNEKLIAIDDLAKMMNITVRTLQYYDRIGLLKPSEITDGDWRREIYEFHFHTSKEKRKITIIRFGSILASK